MPIPTQSSELARKSLRESAAERIKAAIFDGSLKPGERLVDQELQNWLGISRTPLREALNDLTRIGLIETVAQRYTRVVSPQPEDRKDILQTLGALVGGVVRVTVPHLSDLQREELSGAIAELQRITLARETVDHGEKGWAMVDQFIDACPNPYLVTATRETIDALAFKLALTRTGSSTAWDRAHDGYERLLNALQEGDAIAAELAIETVFHL